MAQPPCWVAESLRDQRLFANLLLRKTGPDANPRGVTSSLRFSATQIGRERRRPPCGTSPDPFRLTPQLIKLRPTPLRRTHQPPPTRGRDPPSRVFSRGSPVVRLLVGSARLAALPSSLPVTARWPPTALPSFQPKTASPSPNAPTSPKKISPPLDMPVLALYATFSPRRHYGGTHRTRPSTDVCGSPSDAGHGPRHRTGRREAKRELRSLRPPLLPLEPRVCRMTKGGQRRLRGRQRLPYVELHRATKR